MMRRFILLAITGLTSLAAYAGSDLPIPQNLIARRFPQTKIGDCSIPMPGTAAAQVPLASRSLIAGPIKIQLDKGLITAQSTDRLGRPWTVSLPNEPAGCEAWKADLDGNGMDDLIMVTFNPDSGGGGTVLTVFMMDSQGRPNPWRASGYFNVDEAGVRELLDLNNDRHAELAYLYKEGDQFSGIKQRVSLYRADNAYWKSVMGSFAGLTWPVNTAGPIGTQIDLSNDPDKNKVGVTISSISQDGRQIRLSDGTLIPRPIIVVVDTPGGRTEAIGDTTALLSRAQSSALQINISGRVDTADPPRPLILWAFQGQ